MGSVFDRFNIFRPQITKSDLDATGEEVLAPDIVDLENSQHLNGSLEPDQLTCDEKKPHDECLTAEARLRAAALYDESRRSYVRLLRSRHSSLNVHAEAQIALRRYFQLRSTARKSQQQLTLLLRDARADGRWPQFAERLCECSETLETDFAALEAHVATLQICQGRLANLEFNVRDLENDLFNALDSLVRTLGIVDQLDHDEKWVVNEVLEKPASITSTELDPLLEAFYDKAGDAGLLRDQLSKLDIAHQKLRACRDLMEDQERPLEHSVLHSERKYRERRAVIVHALDRAIKEAGVAKIACLNAGLFPEGSQQCTSEADILLPAPLPHHGLESEIANSRVSSADARTHGEDLDPCQTDSTGRKFQQQLESSNGLSSYDRSGYHDRFDGKTLQIFEWALNLESLASQPIVIPTREEVKAMRSFHGNPQSSFEPVARPRRSSEPSSKGNSLNKNNLQQVLTSKPIRKRWSHPIAEENWDMIEVLRPKIVNGADR